MRVYCSYMPSRYGKRNASALVAILPSEQKISIPSPAYRPFSRKASITGARLLQQCLSQGQFEGQYYRCQASPAVSQPGIVEGQHYRCQASPKVSQG